MGNTPMKMIEKAELKKLEKARKVHSDLKESMSRFKEIRNGQSIDIVDKMFQFMEDDLELRVESVKNEFDNLKNSFERKLKHIKKKLKNRPTRFNVRTNHPKALVYNFPELKRLVLLHLKVQFEFRINKAIPKASSIGKLTWNEIRSINSRIKFGKSEVVTINADIRNLNDICVLENGNIVTVDSEKFDLTLFSPEFKFIETIYKVDNSNFRPAGIATNLNHEIYVTDGYHKLYKLDTELRKVSLFDGVMCSGAQELRNPIGICYHRKLLYVCSHFNRRIQVYTTDFEFKTSFLLDCHPYRIKIGSNVACVTGFKQLDNKHSTFVICFYELATFKLKRRYEKPNKIGLIFEAGSYFYEYSQRKVFCYNPEGDIQEIIPIGSLCDTQKRPFDGVTYINDKVALHINKSGQQRFVLI